MRLGKVGSYSHDVLNTSLEATNSDIPGKQKKKKIKYILVYIKKKKATFLTMKFYKKFYNNKNNDLCSCTLGSE